MSTQPLHRAFRVYHSGLTGSYYAGNAISTDGELWRMKGAKHDVTADIEKILEDANPSVKEARQLRKDIRTLRAELANALLIIEELRDPYHQERLTDDYREGNW